MPSTAGRDLDPDPEAPSPSPTRCPRSLLRLAIDGAPPVGDDDEAPDVPGLDLVRPIGRLWAILGWSSDRPEALRALDRSIAIEPDDALTRVARAAGRRAAGDLEGAIADLDHAVRLSPDLVAIALVRAAVEVDRGRIDRARSVLTGALAGAEDDGQGRALRDALEALDR